MISFNDPLYIIAEIGTGHGGNKSKAQELIQAVAEAGADCAKFQVVIASEILHPSTGMVPLPGGNISLYQRFEELSQPLEFYQFLQEETLKLGLDFLASPFGEESARMLFQMNVGAYKVASPELNHTPLLNQLNSYEKPLILSSGVSKLGDIERALELTPGVPKALLHCITSYPAPAHEYNLRVLPLLGGIFDLPVGVSDHSLDPLAVPLTSLLFKSALLEKHICLDRKTDGLDDPIALDPKDFRLMVQEIRRVEKLTEEDRKGAVVAQLGKDLVEAISGSGKKELAPSERANYERTNRSLHVMKTLNKGHKLTRADLGVLRTEKVLRPGLHPDYLERVLGKKLTRKVDEGQGLIWEDLLEQ